MNRTSLTLVIPLILFTALATTPITVIENAFAGNGHGRHTDGDVSQAPSVSNSCLNPVSDSNTNSNMVSNGNCGGTVSQQGQSGQASSPTTVQNANPTIEVQRSSTTQPTITGPRPETCTQCFDMLNATQQQAINQTLAGPENPLRPPNWPSGITTIEELYNAWSRFTVDHKNFVLTDIDTLLVQIHVDPATADKFFRCLLSSVG